VLADMIATGKSAGVLAAAQAAAPAPDLGTAIDAVIAANPDKAAAYKSGKTACSAFSWARS